MTLEKRRRMWIIREKFVEYNEATLGLLLVVKGALKWPTEL